MSILNGKINNNIKNGLISTRTSKYHRQTKPCMGHFCGVHSKNSSHLYLEQNRQTHRYRNTDHIEFSKKIDKKKFVEKQKMQF